MELKPCPFCGGEAKFNIYSTNTQRNCRGWRYDVRCGKCGAFVPDGCAYETTVVMDDNGNVCLLGDDRDKAIQAWNRRAEG